MLDALSRAFFLGIAGSTTLKKAASRYGMRRPGSFARRFVAGETAEEAIEAARALEQRGMRHSLNYLGESVRHIAEAEAATQAYLSIIDTVIAAGVGRNLSVKLTQLGLDIDRTVCEDNLRRILDTARGGEFFVRIDMENSPCTSVTLDIFETMWQQGYRNVGVVLQACLYRSEADARRVARLGARVRLVKGAYKEPKTVAYQRRADVDAAYVRIMGILLTDGTYPAIATHDPNMINATRAFATQRGIPRDGFEFQMLYGVRRDLQASLHADGQPPRIYIPFGREWFPYFMRRLGERPANVLFVVRSLLSERLGRSPKYSISQLG